MVRECVRIMDMWRDDYTIVEIADELNIEVGKVYFELKTRGKVWKTKYVFEMDEWVKDYRKGKYVKEIADDYDVNDTVVRNLLEKVGVYEVGVGNMITEVKRNQVLRKYDETGDVVDVSNEVGLSQVNVVKVLVDSGVMLERKMKYAEYVEDFIDMYEKGYGLADIERKFGVPKETVRVYLVYYGVAIRRPGCSKKSGISGEDKIFWEGRYSRGDSIRKIAEDYKVAVGTVKKHLEKVGYNTDYMWNGKQKIKKRSFGMFIERGKNNEVRGIESQLKEAYGRGDSMESIEKRFGVGFETVEGIVDGSDQFNREIQLEMGKRYRRWKEKLGAGKAVEEVAREEGVTVMEVEFVV